MSEWRIEKHPVLSIPETRKITFYWNGRKLEANEGGADIRYRGRQEIYIGLLLYSPRKFFKEEIKQRGISPIYPLLLHFDDHPGM